MSGIRVVPEATTSPLYRVKGQRSRWHYPDSRLTPEHCEILRDVNISERGVAESRYGYAAYNATQLPGGEIGVGLWQGEFADGSTRQVVVTPTAVYSDDGTTRTTITGTALTGGAEDRIRFAFTKDQLILNNAVDAPRTWSGSLVANTAALTGIPFTKCTDMMVHQNLLMAVGTTESSILQPTRIRWCDINRETYVVDITTWRSTNRYEIYDGGPAIVGCVDNWGKALIFKKDGMYPGSIVYGVVGSYDFQLDKPLRGFSPIAKHSLVARPEFVFGIAREGAFVVRPDMTFELINLDDTTDWFATNQSRLLYAQACIREKDHQVRTLMSSANNSSGHNRVLVWDWETGDVWWDRPTVAMNFAQRVVVSNAELDWFVSTTGYLYQGNKSTYTSDAGAGIPWQIRMSPNDLGLPGKAKHIISLRTYYKKRTGGQTVVVSAHLDEGRSRRVASTLTMGAGDTWNPSFKWNSGHSWSQEDARVGDTYVNRIAETIAPEWTSSNPAGIIGYQVEFVPLEG